jgi:holo-[acyl-carrier protein] synthase
MIRGNGVDIVEIDRIELLVNKYDRHFLDKIFTPGEIDYCSAVARPGIRFAGRWAAKEAFYKALPGSCQPHSTWKSVEILPDRSSGGRPVISVCSKALGDRLAAEGITSFHLSISHERSFCVASVVLE